MPTPPTQYNFASLPTVDSREPLTQDRNLGVRLASGNGLLARAVEQRRETLAVDIASGTPEHVAILPGPSLVPLHTALVIGGFFLSMLLSLYWLAPVFIAGVAVMVWRWAATTGTMQDPGPVDAGQGLCLPTSFDVRGSVGYWGSVLAVAASGTLFASLVFVTSSFGSLPPTGRRRLNSTPISLNPSWSPLGRCSPLAERGPDCATSSGQSQARW